MCDSCGKILYGKSCYGHLGGTLGDRLFMQMVASGWFTPKEGTSTVYELTETGRYELEKLGVDVYDRRNLPLRRK